MAATMGYGGFLTGPPLIGFLAGVLGFRLAMWVPLLCAVAIAARARQCSIRARVVQFCAQDLGNPPRKTAKRRVILIIILRRILRINLRGWVAGSGGGTGLGLLTTRYQRTPVRLPVRESCCPACRSKSTNPDIPGVTVQRSFDGQGPEASQGLLGERRPLRKTMFKIPRKLILKMTATTSSRPDLAHDNVLYHACELW
jgi:hypothetical protein